MRYEALEVIGIDTAELAALRQKVRDRLTRFAAIQERLIAPDVTYPAVGRSFTYRCGAFQGPALAALAHRLPAEVSPAQAKVAVMAVILRTLEAPGTFDTAGWLRTASRVRSRNNAKPTSQRAASIRAAPHFCRWSTRHRTFLECAGRPDNLAKDLVGRRPPRRTRAQKSEVKPIRTRRRFSVRSPEKTRG